MLASDCISKWWATWMKGICLHVQNTEYVLFPRFRNSLSRVSPFQQKHRSFSVAFAGSAGYLRNPAIYLELY